MDFLDEKGLREVLTDALLQFHLGEDEDDELELEDEVCGKCIKACVHSPRLNTSIEIPVEQPLNQVYYTSS